MVSSVSCTNILMKRSNCSSFPLTEDTMEDLSNPSELRQWSVEVAAAIEEFMTEALAKNCFSPEDAPTLEDDDTCEVSLFLSSLTDMMTAMREFQHSILRHA